MTAGARPRQPFRPERSVPRRRRSGGTGRQSELGEHGRLVFRS